MDQGLVTLIAAVGGTLVGGVTSFAGTYVTQRHQVRRERLAKELERREALYGQFIEEAAALFLDALDKTLDDAKGLVRIGALLARINLSAAAEVTEEGRKVMAEIIAAYRLPPVSLGQKFMEMHDAFADPLDGFSRACRAEREAMLREL